MTRAKSNKIDRKKIDEAVLAERLGLDEPWIERWEQDGKWIEKSCAPDQLPEFIRSTHTETEIKDVEAVIDWLVAAGCSRPVIYFCIDMLSPSAEEIRSGREWTAVPSKVGGDDSLIKRQPKLATSEDLETVANTAKEARKQIHRYQRELLLVADIGEHPLPDSMMTQFTLAVDAIDMLESSLTWVAELAEAYTASFEATLMKSKGLLYLTAYVSMYAEKGKLRSPRHRAEKGIGAPNKPEVRARHDDRTHDNALASLANTCSGKDGGWSPSDLYAKLHKFENDHPRLFAKLQAKLNELHEFSAR